MVLKETSLIMLSTAESEYVAATYRLATVRFGPGSALLAPNLNLNLMFGSAFAQT